MKRELLLLTLAFGAITTLEAQTVYRPQPLEWEHIVKGGQFIDRMEAMPVGKTTDKTWGDLGVASRYIDNGIERDDISFWGGNIAMDESGKYHLFVCGWPESSEKGHFAYPQSKVYHATCDNPVGPFKVVKEMGLGHNPEVVPLKDGSYMVYHVTQQPDRMDISKNMRYYYSNSLNGKWKTRIMKIDMRDRPVRLGGGTWFHNMSFCQREDGSILAILRNGSIWISETGTSTFNLVTERSIYPMVDGRYEDPVIWYDGIQYNVIMNDWIGRVAFYLRSKDGVNWVSDPGTAYDTSVSFHEDGVKEEWHKYERIRMMQDEQGRAIQANFAVIDSEKHSDMGNDNHNSKNIAIPLNKGVLLTMMETTPISAKTKTISVKISAEEGFDPQTEVDVESLRFGANNEVNFGRGAKPRWILYIIAILSTLSCERRELEEAFEDTAKIPVSIDWSLT
ncbi:MAG: glycoside hydrolase family protein, partial [Rikenellaceae bacterium]